MRKIFVLLLAGLSVACVNEPRNNSGTNTEKSDFEKAQEYAAAISPIPAIDNRWDSETLSGPDSVKLSGSYTDPITGAVYTNPYRVTTEKEIDALINHNEFIVLENAWDEEIWPGCLVRGDVKSGFKPTSVPIFAERKPFRVNINVVNGAEDKTGVPNLGCTKS